MTGCRWDNAKLKTGGNGWPLIVLWRADRDKIDFVFEAWRLQHSYILPRLSSPSSPCSGLTAIQDLLEEQLCDGGEWLFNTEQPGLADITFYSIFSWVQSLIAADDLIPPDVFPFVTSVSWSHEDKLNLTCRSSGYGGSTPCSTISVASKVLQKCLQRNRLQRW